MAFVRSGRTPALPRTNKADRPNVILPRRTFALYTTLLYAIGGCAWIVMSDRLLAQIFDRDTFASLSSYKGLAFIAVTSVLLFIALRRAGQRGALAEPEQRGRGGATPLFLMAAAASILIVGSAIVGYRALARSGAQYALDQARAMVDFQAKDLGRWLEAQRTNAALLAANDKTLAIADRVSLRGWNREATQLDLRGQAVAFGFADADFIDSSGHSVIGAGDVAVEPAIAAAAKKSFATREPALVDLHVDAKGGGPRFGYVAPALARPGTKNSELAIYAELAAHDFIQPFVREWRFQNARGAGLLARREADDIVLLIGLPQDGGALMSRRQPYATSTEPAAAFMRGEAQAMRGVGWNGVPVFAAGQKAPGTDWELVAWIDEADALAELNGVARMAGLLAAIGVAACWIIAGFLWQNQRLARARADQRFRVTFEQALIGMGHVGLEGQLLRVNRRLCEIFGYSREELLAMDVYRLTAPEQHAEVTSQLAKVRAGALDEFTGERRYIRKDGSVVDVAISVVLVRGEADEPDYLMSVFEDISRRKTAEEDLRESEERFRLALAGSNEGLWDWRPETGKSYYSPRWKAMLGYSNDEIEDHESAWRRVAEPRALDIVRQQFAEIRAGQRTTFEFETRMRHKDGRWLDILSRGLPVFNAAGRMIRVVGTDIDITLRKSHEAELRLAAMVYTSTREGIVVTGADEKILMVNPAFERITGYNEASMRGQTMRVVQSGRQGREFYQAMWKSIREVGYFSGEIWNRRKNGEIYPQLATISAMIGEAGEVTNYIGVFSDIGRLKQSETQLEFLAHHDPLTHLPNRLLLRLRVEHAIERARRSGTIGAVLFLDLDRFKTINDSLGHAAGDQLLVEAAERWSKRLRSSDTLARLGGDEFAVLLEEIPEPHAAAALAQNLIEATAAHFALAGGREACVGLSVGISLFPENGNDAEALIQHAGSALDLAKQNGGSAVRFYSDAMTREANSRLELEAGMRRGLERGEFVLQYQPLIALADRRIVGVEALARWRSPSGLVSPADFIPLAEETGLIIPLGEWVLREACGRMKAWRDSGVDLGVVAVNLSPLQLDRPDICQRIKAILQETGLPPQCLEIEITESALLEQGGDAETKLAALKALGLRIAIDDFGAGHSSLFYLKRFPIDKLKLDRSFIIDIPADPTSMEIAAAIVRLAHSLKIEALAEGVETEAQAEFLAVCGCRLAQGYLFAKPLWEIDLLKKFAVAPDSAQTMAG